MKKIDKKNSTRKERRVRRNDKVVIISGREKGKEGIVTRIFPTAERAIVAGLNYRVKNVKAGVTGAEGGQFKVEAPIHISNLKVIEKGQVDPKESQVAGEDNE